MFYFESIKSPENSFVTKTLDINEILDTIDRKAYCYDFWGNIGYGLPVDFYGLSKGEFSADRLYDECQPECVASAIRYLNENYRVYACQDDTAQKTRIECPKYIGEHVDIIWPDINTECELVIICVDVLHQFYTAGAWHIGLYNPRVDSVIDISHCPEPTIVSGQPRWRIDGRIYEPVVWFGRANELSYPIWWATEDSALWELPAKEDCDSCDVSDEFYYICINDLKEAVAFPEWCCECGLDLHYYDDFLDIYDSCPIDLSLPLSERKQLAAQLLLKSIKEGRHD